MLFINNNVWVCVYALFVCKHVLQTCIFVCNLIFLLFVYKACMCACVCVCEQRFRSGPLESYPISQRIKSRLVYNLLYFVSLRSHVICSRQPTYLLITPSVSVPCSPIGLKMQKLGYQDNIRKETAASITSWRGMEWKVNTINISR